MTTVLDFTKIDTPSTLETLNKYLAKHSYIHGFHPTQLDATVLAELKHVHGLQAYCHVMRWKRHIESYSMNDQKSWKTPENITLHISRSTAKDAEDDFDPFGEETAEDIAAATKLTAAAKATKPVKKPVINRSQLVIDVKPASIDTNLDELEQMVRRIQMDGLEWSIASKKIPVAFGLMKLQIGCIIIDDLVQTDDILERIECLGLSQVACAQRVARRNTGEDEDLSEEDEDPEGMVQSAEIVSFNKL